MAAKLDVPEERIDFGVEVGSDKIHLNNRVAVVKVGLKDAAAAAKVRFYSLEQSGWGFGGGGSGVSLRFALGSTTSRVRRIWHS